MKKLPYLALLYLLSLGMPARSQTLEIEYKSMMDRYLSKTMSQIEFRDMSFAWRALIDSVGYPEVPYDTLGEKVEYVFINSLEGISRETIVNRVSEWAAVSFGNTNGLLTQQGSANRLILNGSMEILFPDLFMVYKNAWRGYVETEMQNTSICYFTMVFTIREGKMKSQILNLSYEYTDFVSDRSVSRTLNSCFPISSNQQDEWKAIIGLVNETRRSLHAMMDLLTGYIMEYENDYSINQAMVREAVSQDMITSPLPAHAHNDYEHERPLFDALENGFRSVEADVFSLGDSLYVAHDRKDIIPGRTLRELYLAPLMEYFSDDRGAIYNSVSPLILLIDIKDDGLTTYQLLEVILYECREILCHLTPEGYVSRSVMVVVSGNRPIEYMKEQIQRLAFVDGRLKDLDEEYPPHLMPLISDRWGKYFSWRGKGGMPEKEKVQLRSYVQDAHDKGRLVRFWAIPDAPGKERDAIWTELLEAGVDLINTDDLAGLKEFLSERGVEPGNALIGERE